MNMRTSRRGLIALAVSEGIVPTTYKDSKGILTFGIGITNAAGILKVENWIGKTAEIPYVLMTFQQALRQYEDAVNSLVKVPLLQCEFDALVHFTYNVGPAGLARSKLLKNVNANNKTLAFDQGFHGWLKPPELVSRRDKERKMAKAGAYGGSSAPLYTVDKNLQPKRIGVVDLSDKFPSAVTPKPQTEQPSTLWAWIKRIFRIG